MRWQDILQKAPPFDIGEREGAIETEKRAARQEATDKIVPWAEEFIDDILESRITSQDGVGPYVIHLPLDGGGLDELNDIIMMLGNEPVENKLKEEYNAQSVAVKITSTEVLAEPKRKKTFSQKVDSTLFGGRNDERVLDTPTADPSGDTTEDTEIPTAYEITFDMKEVI